ncbi:MAG: nucleotidyltransferase family protein [Clostridiales bacterium]|nr:nucleotidyltransferase family protein [Clostridiales bacterium]
MLTAYTLNLISIQLFINKWKGEGPKKPEDDFIRTTATGAENMRPVVGIICEYDPFHLGHARQFALIREKLPDAAIVCLMSGPFTQRGMPALFTPAFRAEAALRAGADMVLELPCAFAVQDAEHFALGGISILSQLGFVTHLSYGVEDKTVDLAAAARLMEQPTELFDRVLRDKLASGASFAAAQGAALEACLGNSAYGETTPTTESRWQQPNLILALCYQRAILRLHSPLIPLPVQRIGAYHDEVLPVTEATQNIAEIQPAVYPSATAVRRAYLGGATAAAEAACGYPLPSAQGGQRICRPDALDSVLLYRLRSMTPEQLRMLPLCTEGLENRLQAAAHQAASREELLDGLKTKRYARARLSRLCTHGLLGVTEAMLNTHPLPEYVRLLGFRKDSRELLTALKQSRIAVIAKAADGDLNNPLYTLDNAAYDLWALGAGTPAGLMMRSQVVRV